MSDKKVLAIDLGASSGRGILGTFDGEKIKLEEIHRFSNDPVMTVGGFFWDTYRLLHEIKAAILKSAEFGGCDTLGIDTWGVDYGYLDKTGALLSTPYHYRDERTSDIQPYVFEKFASFDEIYNTTGLQSMNFNTIYQMAADLRDRPWVVENAEKMLFTPDLLGYLLTGKMATEYTIASTGAVLDAKKREYAADLLGKFGIPSRLFCDIVKPGTPLGGLLPFVEEETGNTGVKVVKVASHDTASAVLSVPAVNEDFLYISSGTWSLMGIESKTPLITEASLKYQFTNEGGAADTYRILKNIMGLWLEQESRRQWTREGTKYSFDELSQMALAAKPFQCFVNPDDDSFQTAGNMPKRIREYCRRTGQHVPETVGEVVRCIFESLALKYRWVAEKLEEMTGKTYPYINIVGGGTKDPLLCQMAANACGARVYAGPIEATALGNIAVQMMAIGEIKDLKEARKIIKNSFDTKQYEPQDCDAWQKAYETFKSKLSK